MTDERDMEAVVSAGETIAETAAEAAGEAAEVTEAAAGVTEEIKETAEAAEEILTEAAEEVSDAVTEKAEEAAETAEAVQEKAAEAAETAADAIEEKASEAAADAIEEKASEAAEAAMAAVTEVAAEVSEEASEEAEQLELDFPEEPEENVPEEKPYDMKAAQESYEAETPVILFDHVHKEYEGQVEDSVALVDVSFSIKKGEFVFIVGPSGSGKSTMIRLMMREISPSGGKIYIAGKDLAKLRKRHVSKYRRNIGIVFQDFRLLPDRNVYDNVAFAQRVIGAPKRNIPKEVSKVLHLVGLSQKYKSFPNELSGGEQQRVAIARALVNNPMIILADEPTGNLDPQNSYEIMSLLEEINRRGTTVVIVTHDQTVVDQMQKRVVALREGTIVEDNKKGGYGRG